MINNFIMALWLMFKGVGVFLKINFYDPENLSLKNFLVRAHYIETGDAKEGVTAVYFF